MYTAYFDESGYSANEEFVSIGGFIGLDTEWAKFNTAWNAALGNAGAPYLHMREFAHSRGVFKGWTEQQRQALLGALLRALNSVELYATAAVISVSDFRSLNPEATEKFVDPFFLCFQETVRGASIVAAYQPPNVKVNMVFDRNDQFRSTATTIYDLMQHSMDFRSRMGALDFQDMRANPGLQAADLLAYEVRHFHHTLKAGTFRAVRYPLKEILAFQLLALQSVMVKKIAKYHIELQMTGSYDEVIEALRPASDIPRFPLAPNQMPPRSAVERLVAKGRAFAFRALVFIRRLTWAFRAFTE